MPWYKYEPESVSENCSYKLYCDRSVIAGLTAHTNTLMLDKTIKAESSIDVAITNSHNLHSTTTHKLQNMQTWKKSL